MLAESELDRSYLEWHHGSWRVTYPVPVKLKKRLGKTRIKQPLQTDNLRKANKLKPAVIADIQKMLANEAALMAAEQQRAEDIKAGKIDAARLFGWEKREERKRVARTHADNMPGFMDEVEDAYQGFLGKPLDLDFITIDEDVEIVPVYAPERWAAAEAFIVAFRSVVDIDELHERYLMRLKLTHRTKEDDRRVLRLLKRWCEGEGIDLVPRDFTLAFAHKFITDLPKLTGATASVSQYKYLQRLRKFWQDLKSQGLVTENVWKEQNIQADTKSEKDLERHFTLDEVRRLLMGGAPQKLHDIMMIGLLTGARLDAICCLTAKDVDARSIIFKKQKREKRRRRVPMHPALAGIFKRRLEGKQPDDDVFPDWPGPKKEGSLRERSFKASNAFTAYRQKLGIDEKVVGNRRSKVNFHSFRRWFITHLRRHAPLDLTQAIVGHVGGTMTDDIYNFGPSFLAAKEKIGLLELPPLIDAYVEEPLGLSVEYWHDPFK